MEGSIPNHVYTGDCLEVMRQWLDACVDHCIADPPFGMSKKRGLGWAFSSHVTMEEAWDRFSKDEFFQFNVSWLSEVCRVVKPNGNILTFGTFHNIYQLGFILQNVLNRRVLNSIVWFKPNAQPNITARTLTESTEQIVWAVNNPPGKAKKWTFNYWQAKEMAGGKQMRNLWEIPYTPASERANGSRVTSKPTTAFAPSARALSRRASNSSCAALFSAADLAATSPTRKTSAVTVPKYTAARVPETHGEV